VLQTSKFLIAVPGSNGFQNTRNKAESPSPKGGGVKQQENKSVDGKFGLSGKI